MIAVMIEAEVTENETDRVLHALREQIISGVKAGGDRLVERTIAQELEVSRVPVRQALRQLKLEGLVDQRARSGWRVHEMTASDVADLHEVHRAFDILANRQAALRRTASDLAELRAAADACAAAVLESDVIALRDAGFRFRASVIASAHDAILDEVQSALRSRMRQLIFALADTGRVVALYEAIYESIERQDADAAEFAITAFLGAFRSSKRARILESLKTGDLAALRSPFLADAVEDPQDHIEQYAPDFMRVLPALRRQILRGDRRPGDALAERALSAEFDVSRLPIRQAVEALVNEGLVSPGTSRAPARVRGLTASEAEDLLEVCLTLDALSARLAAHRPTPADIAGLKRLLREEEQLAARGDADRLLEKVFEFRHRLHLMSVNQVVLTIDRIVDSRFRLMISRAPFAELALTAHRLLIDAIEHRDPTLAEAIFRELLSPPGRRELLLSADTPAG